MARERSAFDYRVRKSDGSWGPRTPRPNDVEAWRWLLDLREQDAQFKAWCQEHPEDAAAWDARERYNNAVTVPPTTATTPPDEPSAT